MPDDPADIARPAVSLQLACYDISKDSGRRILKIELKNFEGKGKPCRKLLQVCAAWCKPEFSQREER